MSLLRRSSKLGYIALIIALSGCTTTGLNSSLTPTAIPQETKVLASGELIAALDGGLISRIKKDTIVRADKSTALQKEYLALEYTPPGEAVLWQGKSLSGRIVPSQPYRVGSQDCRQYEHTVVERGVETTAKGTACRNEGGSWSLLS